MKVLVSAPASAKPIGKLIDAGGSDLVHSKSGCLFYIQSFHWTEWICFAECLKDTFLGGPVDMVLSDLVWQTWHPLRWIVWIYYPTLRSMFKALLTLHRASKLTSFLESSFSVRLHCLKTSHYTKDTSRICTGTLSLIAPVISDKQLDVAQQVFHQYGEGWLKGLINRNSV